MVWRLNEVQVLKILNLIIPVFLAFIAMIPMSFVHGDIMEVMGVSVYTDKDSYGKGETIQISGEIRSANGMTVSQNIPVTIKITSDTFQKPIATLVTYPSINGNFGINIPTTNSSWKTSDTYTVVASYGTIQGYNDNAIFSFEVGDNNLLSPLQQSKLGIAPDKIECRSDLIVINSKNDFSACVKQQTAQILVKRGWTRPESPISIIGLNENYMVGQPINATIIYTGYMNGGFYPDVKILNANNGSKVWSNCLYSHTELAGGGGIGTGTYNVTCFNKYPVINESGIYTMVASVDKNLAKATFDVIQSNTTQTNSMANLGNDAGIITMGNQTYYFETPHYSKDAYFNSPQISFHGIVFTLFPSGFRGGLPYPCGTNSDKIQYYWTDAKFVDDGNHELLHTQGDTPPCPTNPVTFMFSNHTNPQAGLVFYDGKMKLLTSVGNSDENTSFQTIKVQNANASVVYQIDNGDVLSVGAYGLRDTNSINGETDGASIILISLDTISNGTLTIKLPRTLIDAKANHHDDNFTVLLDGKEISYDETENTTTNRALSIQYLWGTKSIEIIGYGYYNNQPPPMK